ncbi:hypothetical protein RFI_20101, partial [Reticulomyxa filosa]
KTLWTKKYVLAMDFNLFLFDEFINPQNVQDTLQHDIWCLIRDEQNDTQFYLHTIDKKSAPNYLGNLQWNDHCDLLYRDQNAGRSRKDAVLKKSKMRSKYLRFRCANLQQRNEWCEELEYQYQIMYELTRLPCIHLQLAGTNGSLWLPAPIHSTVTNQIQKQFQNMYSRTSITLMNSKTLTPAFACDGASPSPIPSIMGTASPTPMAFPSLPLSASPSPAPPRTTKTSRLQPQPQPQTQSQARSQSRSHLQANPTAVQYRLSLDSPLSSVPNPTGNAAPPNQPYYHDLSNLNLNTVPLPFLQSNKINDSNYQTNNINISINNSINSNNNNNNNNNNIGYKTKSKSKDKEKGKSKGKKKTNSLQIHYASMNMRTS